MPDFGEIKSVDIRELWPNEARDFTPWLVENIDRLSNALGMDLEVTAREADVGNFSLDLLAKDLGSGRPVVIENQFGATNHDHLGKVITYAAGVDATAVIWLTESVRDEHRQALEWLNRRTDTEVHFFAVVVRETAERQISPRGEAYRRYFQILIDALREQHRFTGARVAQPQSWYLFPSGVQGVNYGTSFALGGRVRTELYIDQGDAETNKALFDSLLAQKEDIEQEFREPLEWERLDERRASRIAVYREGHIEQSDEKLADIRGWTTDRLLQLKRVLGPRLVRAEKKVIEQRGA